MSINDKHFPDIPISFRIRVKISIFGENSKFMTEKFSNELYDQMIEWLFGQFPSFQKVGVSAYKPGLGNIKSFDKLLGEPHRAYKVIHVAGTNGKGSVSNMLASSLASCGYKVGLYTSPHILDFRERMRCRWEKELNYISREEVWNFVSIWRNDFEKLDLSFFEITTAMAFFWFKQVGVDVAIIETGLGGRLDSTNIISPELSIITNIGLDHCDILGTSLAEIAFEKAGIIKASVPVVIGESDEETADVFREKVMSVNNNSLELLTFADQQMSMQDTDDNMLGLGGDFLYLLEHLDMKGEYQEKNLRTVLVALSKLSKSGSELGNVIKSSSKQEIMEAIMDTASRMEFRGRWEEVWLEDNIRAIFDIGHNSHGLKYNFRQLGKILDLGEIKNLIIVYGAASDKDVEEIFSLFPTMAQLIFTNAQGKRAVPAKQLYTRYLESRLRPDNKTLENDGHRNNYMVDDAQNVRYVENIANVVDEVFNVMKIKGLCDEDTLVYFGGSTFVIAEILKNDKFSIKKSRKIC